MGDVVVRDRSARDRPRVAEFLRERHAARVARFDELVYPLDFPALLAEVDDHLSGVLTYAIRNDRCEVLTLHCSRQWLGMGTMLLAAVRTRALDAGCRTVWVVTTNDNVDALRFYQRRGFRLATLRTGAVDDARRRLKPELPRTGLHGIPLRDELVLDMPVG